MENFDDLIRQQKEYKTFRDDKFKSDSKHRLTKILNQFKSELQTIK